MDLVQAQPDQADREHDGERYAEREQPEYRHDDGLGPRDRIRERGVVQPRLDSLTVRRPRSDAKVGDGDRDEDDPVDDERPRDPARRPQLPTPAARG